MLSSYGGGWPGFQTVMLMAPNAARRVLPHRRRCAGDRPYRAAGAANAPRGPKPAATPVGAAQLRLCARGVAFAAFPLAPGRHPPRPFGRPAISPAPIAASAAATFTGPPTCSAPITAVIEAAAAADGTLTIRGVPGYRQVAPGVFWNQAGSLPPWKIPVSAMFAFVTPDDQAPRAMAPLLSVGRLGAAVAPPGTPRWPAC